MHILANDQSTTLNNSIDDPSALWIAEHELPAALGFELKPEGACQGDLCVPIRQDEDNELLKSLAGVKWINASLLASKLDQPVVRDEDSDTWSFGATPATRQSTLESATAPDFEIEDRKGNTIRLSDYRGKKVLLVTWASW